MCIILEKEVCKFNYIVMSFSESSMKNKKSIQTSLEDLYTTDEMSLLKRVIAVWSNNQDNNILNTLFSCNLYVSMFDTWALKEE